MNDTELRDLLAYWRAALRHEEALSARLRVERGRSLQAVTAVDLLRPGFGSRYAKLVPREGAGDVAPFLLRAQPSIEAPIEGDLVGLFEGWLREEYRREKRNALGLPTEAKETRFMVGFPVVHLPARAELDVLLRLPIERVDWLTAEGALWVPPSYRDRVGGRLLAPPVSARVVAQPVEGDELPYAVGEQLLSRVMHVPDEDIAQLLREGRASIRKPAGYLDGVVRLLRDEGLSGDEPAELIRQLAHAMGERIGHAGASSWPVAVLYDASRSAPTGSLQAELRSIEDEPGAGRRSPALYSYLSGDPLPVGRDIVRSLPWPVALTPTQREAVERLGGSRLTAVQGPPGTGKTRLVVAALAETVVESARALLSDRPGADLPALAVIASTNNRAVDNALDPLGLGFPEDRLPPGLRVGSREVVSEATVSGIERAIRWLLAQEPAGAADALDAVRRRFDEQLRAVRTALEPVRAAARRWSRLAAVRAELERAAVRRRAVDDALFSLPPASEDDDAARRLHEAASAAQGPLELMLEAIESGKPRRRAITAPWKKAKVHVETVRDAVRALSLPVAIVDPEDDDTPRADMSAWGEAVESLLDAFEEARRRVPAPLGRPGERARLEAEASVLDARLEVLRGSEGELAASGSEDAGPIYEATVKERHALFLVALDLREAWARVHRDRLVALLRQLLIDIKRFATIGEALAGGGPPVRDLRALFPVMGCTLLSFAGSFPFEPGCIDRLIVDEAGQCHPAFVVPALYRARSAMLIGDVNQLEPVTQLDAEEEKRALARSGCRLPPERLAPYRVTSERPTSAQALADRACTERVRLREHFRCQPEIIAISDRLCDYGLLVRTPARTWGNSVALLQRAHVLVPVFGEQARYLGSWRNDAEVSRVVDVVARLLDSGLPPSEIAVLTPYRGQLHALRRALAPVLSGWGGDAESVEDAGVAIGTVHRFQGGERDVVVLSTTITEERSLPFLNEKVNLVNVAVSRARVHLVVVGDPRTLARGRITAELLPSGQGG